MQQCGKSWNRALAGNLAAVFVVQGILLAIAGWHNRNLLNADAISYMRIASYYLHGQTHLMISGYWGPMLSWLMVPLLALGVTPLDAGEIMVGFSAAFFLLACIILFRACQLPLRAVIAGAWIVAVATIRWFASQVTPDLLVCGFVVLAVSQMISPDWLDDRNRATKAGLCWGAAYLAKAVAFPLSFLTGLGVAGLCLISHSGNRKQILSSLGWTWLATLAVSVPWIVTLSIHYHALTISTSAPLTHALVGPPDKERDHPSMVTFHHPEPGRITSWEDPSRMPYNRWSPLDSPEYAWYQAKLIVSNFTEQTRLLKDFDFIGLGYIGLAVAVIPFRRWRERLRLERWRWVVVPLVCIMIIYSPVSSGEERFLYGAFPLLLIASLGATTLYGEGPTAWKWSFLTLAVVVGSFGEPALYDLRVSLSKLEDTGSDCAQELAARLKEAKVVGPVAGSGVVGGCRAGLYVAYLLDQPWLGDERHPTTESFKNSGAQIVVLNRHLRLAHAATWKKDFRDLDGVLFLSKEEADKFPLKVFERRGENNPP